MADKPIGQLNVFPAGAEISTTNTLFAVQYSNAAYQLNGQRFVNALATLLDGHGGVASVSYTPPTAPSLVGTMTITLADQTTTTVSINNGKGISSIGKTSTSGLVDTYTITYNDATTSTFTVTNGATGQTGLAAYVHIKYSATYPVTTMSDLPDEWMGIYSNNSATASSIPSDYTWYKIKGSTGTTGDPGVSIESVQLTSGSHAPGTLDTYTITYSDASTSTFQVYNGLNGSGAGTVTSVGVAAKTVGGVDVSGLTVEGSPVTSSGDITIGHSNSITAQTTQAIYPIKIDKNGHISSYGAAVTPITDVSGKADKRGNADIVIEKSTSTPADAQFAVKNTTDTTDTNYENVALTALASGLYGIFDNRRNKWLIGADVNGRPTILLPSADDTSFVNYTIKVGTESDAQAGRLTIVLE